MERYAGNDCQVKLSVFSEKRAIASGAVRRAGQDDAPLGREHTQNALPAGVGEASGPGARVSAARGAKWCATR